MGGSNVLKGVRVDGKKDAAPARGQRQINGGGLRLLCFAASACTGGCNSRRYDETDESQGNDQIMHDGFTPVRLCDPLHVHVGPASENQESHKDGLPGRIG